MESLSGLFVVAGFFLAVAAFVYFRNRKPTPKSDYPQYVTEGCVGLPPKGSLLIEVEAIGPFADDATLTPFFQRRGDDWSAKGKYEAYRWWASFATIKLVPGIHKIEVSFDANWTAIIRSSRDTNPEAYAEALHNAARVGFTIGNITGLGHGIARKGTFKVLQIKTVGEIR